MPRRRKRRVPNWSAILWFIVIVNVASGLAFSRATATTVLRVYGARPEDKTQIVREAQFLKNTPCFRVNKARLEEKIRFLPWVKTASLKRNVFGRAEVQVNLRRPVATVGSDALLDEDGVVFLSKPPSEPLPHVALETGLSANGGFGSLYPLERAAALATLIAKRASLEGATIELRRTGSVAVRVLDGPLIELGRLEGLEAKLTAFDEQMSLNAQLLQESRELNFVDPARPTQKKKSQ